MSNNCEQISKITTNSKLPVENHSITQQNSQKVKLWTLPGIAGAEDREGEGDKRDRIE